jgi:hypothetical protein
MKTTRTALTAMAVSLAASPAFAVSTHTVYNSGILVLVFLGFCALVVVSQLIPSIILLSGMLKEAFAGIGTKRAETESRG